MSEQLIQSSFEGFIPPVKNFFHMPNQWIDICAEIKNLAELKVVQYVLRHTWGFREYGIAKAISIDEFMNGRRRGNGTRIDKGTGLSHHSVIDGLKAAIKHGYLICEIDTSDLARVKKSYAIKMLAETIEDIAPGEDVAPPEDVAPGEESTASSEDVAPPGVKMLHPRGEESSHRSEKDTIERHLRKTLKKDTTLHKTPEKAKSKKETPGIEISSEGMEVYRDWCSLFKVNVSLTPSIAKAAESLVEPCTVWPISLGITRVELLKRIKDWLYENDKNGYYKRGVKLYDISREFEGWQSAQERPKQNGHKKQEYSDDLPLYRAPDRERRTQ